MKMRGWPSAASMPWPEPSQATRRELTRKVSGGGIMERAVSNRAPRLQSPFVSSEVEIRFSTSLEANGVGCAMAPDYSADMTDAAISIRDLAKTYKGGKRALDGVSFDVPRGQIFGLLGPNGAGKSTLINILAGLVMKSSGKVTIWGFDIDEHPRNSKRSEERRVGKERIARRSPYH